MMPDTHGPLAARTPDAPTRMVAGWLDDMQKGMLVRILDGTQKGMLVRMLKDRLVEEA